MSYIEDRREMLLEKGFTEAQADVLLCLMLDIKGLTRRVNDLEDVVGPSK